MSQVSLHVSIFIIVKEVDTYVSSFTGSFLQISSFDMVPERGEILFNCILPYSLLADVTVRGDIVLTQLPHDLGISILTNWKTSESVIVKLCDLAVSTSTILISYVG